MRRVVIRACALWLALAAAAAARAVSPCDDPFADPYTPLDLQLRLSRATWHDLVFDEPADRDGCEQYPYHPVAFRCGDGEPWITIGARHKRGDQRGRDTDEKPPLKLDFNRYVKGQRWPAALGSRGFRKLSLHTGQPDGPGTVLAALLTEPLGMLLLREQVPSTPRVAFARLTVHFSDDDASEYHGVYILLEDIDRTALRKRFGDARGRLVKNTGGDCDGVRFDDGPPNEAAARFDAWMAADPADHAGAWYAVTESSMHLDELLRQEAVREILATDDNIFNDLRNYYAFDPVVGKRHWIPWDSDNSFRSGGDHAAHEPLGKGKCSPIGERTRCHPEIRPRYFEIACEVIGETLSPDAILAAAERLDALLRPLIPLEQERVWPGKDPFATASGVFTYQTSYEHLQTWVPARIAAVRAEIESERVACPEEP